MTQESKVPSALVLRCFLMCQEGDFFFPSERSMVSGYAPKYVIGLASLNREVFTVQCFT